MSDYETVRELIGKVENPKVLTGISNEITFWSAHTGHAVPLADRVRSYLRESGADCHFEETGRKNIALHTTTDRGQAVGLALTMLEYFEAHATPHSKEAVYGISQLISRDPSVIDELTLLKMAVQAPPTTTRRRRVMSEEEKKGVEAIVYLQAMGNVEEPEERALANWRSFSDNEKKKTLEIYEMFSQFSAEG